jgi:hypothetical protein
MSILVHNSKRTEYTVHTGHTKFRKIVETSYYRLYTTSNTISMNAVTRAWRLQLEECAERRKPEPLR